jgi:hypothetical protein
MSPWHNRHNPPNQRFTSESQEYSSQKKNSGPTRALTYFLHAITSCFKHLQMLWKAKNTKIISDRALNCRQMVLYPSRMNNWVTVTSFTGLWREAVFKVFCAICFFAASKITYKQFLTQKKLVSYPKCI